jgi:serine/threonine-protein kinase
MSSDSRAGPPSQQGVPSDLGRPFGRFRLLDKIGEGDVAEVYRAVAVGVEGFERRIAVKVMQRQVREEQAGRLFAEEARVSAMLDHPAVVQVYEFGVVDGAPFIAMEYLRGKNLAETMTALRAQGDRLAPPLALFIAHQVAGALAHAHELQDGHGRPLGLVHGEVTAANVMLVREGAVKLLDFGMASLVRDPRYTVTRRGRPLPRPTAYLSPEQVAGLGADARSDVFSLGIVLWEMLTGQRLFAADSDRKTLANVTRAEIPPPSRIAPNIPPELDRLVLAALVRDTSRRYPSAERFMRDLEELMEVLPGRHGDLTALLERVWGSPRDTGPVRTLAGAGSPPLPLRRTPAPSRPEIAGALPVAPAGPGGRPDAGREPTTRLMGDTTLAALLGREPRRRSHSWRGLLGDPRALSLGAAGLVLGLVTSAAVLTRGSRAPSAPGVSDQGRPAPAPLAARPPVVVPTPPAPGSCDSPDAGPPCVGVPGAVGAPEGRAVEARGGRPSGPRAARGRAPIAPIAPARAGAPLDRRPNPFEE